ncbi:unnamed protein product [Prunus armeniaca]|uniref:Uncharacterized protein n=1 Tax=Prunus armeniaca TaxID=36596 RepID=A0A6J5WHJ7_PRUAR|nr:unnamed protein product [Prunus armeniaca]
MSDIVALEKKFQGTEAGRANTQCYVLREDWMLSKEYCPALMEPSESLPPPLPRVAQSLSEDASPTTSFLSPWVT